MPRSSEKQVWIGDGARIPRVGEAPDSAHYLRQATITLRRRSSWLNQMWCRNRQAHADAATWKP